MSARAENRPAMRPTLSSPLDVERVRRDFPALAGKAHGHPLVYLDSAATTQKPLAVLDRLRRSYVEECANIHRGVYQLSERATAAHEAARDKVRRFIGAEQASEIVFVRGATEGINLVAQSYGRSQIHQGDEILISEMEHHSNIVPWQMLAEERGAHLKVAPMDDRGDLILPGYEKLLGPRTKIVAFTAVSNALGTVNPAAAMIAAAHHVGAVVLLDAAQAAPHAALDVRELDCDFLVFSGHKLYGPTGIGVLYGKERLLAAMPPWQGGGDMILSVTFEKTTYAPPPAKFEAGTPHIQGAIGLGAAIDYVESLGLAAIERYETDLLAYAEASLARLPGLRLVGQPQRRAAAISFVLDGIHPHDIGTILDRYGVAIRAGHHCAQPAMQRMGVSGTARVSLAFYNKRDEIDTLVSCLGEAQRMFRP
jgi:cysteine desulfurase/selenocysteine lyase